MTRVAIPVLLALAAVFCSMAGVRGQWDPSAPEHRIPAVSGLPSTAVPPVDSVQVTDVYGDRLRQQWVVSLSLVVSAEDPKDIRSAIATWLQGAVRQRRLILVDGQRPVFVSGHFGAVGVHVEREFP